MVQSRGWFFFEFVFVLFSTFIQVPRQESHGLREAEPEMRTLGTSCLWDSEPFTSPRKDLRRLAEAGCHTFTIYTATAQPSSPRLIVCFVLFLLFRHLLANPNRWCWRCFGLLG